MANFEKSMKILMELEFSSPSDALHKNPTEPVYTYMGIYYKAHPTWDGWRIVRETLSKYNNNLKLASEMLYINPELTKMVYSFYKSKFWDVARLDEVNNQNTADEIMIFGVNVGMRTAIKTAQGLVGFVGDDVDGKVGKATLRVLNSFDSTVFDEEFDKLENDYYQELIEADPERKIYAKGWRKRAEYV